MGESIPLAAPVPVEQAVLETFFSHLGIFSYDKAKDNVEKEREANKSAGASWLSLLAALAHLAAAEKVYHSLTYLGQKLGTSAPLPGPREERKPRRGCHSRSAPAAPSFPRLPHSPPGAVINISRPGECCLCGCVPQTHRVYRPRGEVNPSHSSNE